MKNAASNRKDQNRLVEDVLKEGEAEEEEEKKKRQRREKKTGAEIRFERESEERNPDGKVKRVNVKGEH